MSKPCPDCGALPGEFHGDDCDVARCMFCGGQRLGCAFEDEEGYVVEDHFRGSDLWTGRWPGDEDAERLGFWCYWGPDFGETGWVQCDADHPGATQDLNRLARDAYWNHHFARWELRG